MGPSALCGQGLARHGHGMQGDGATLPLPYFVRDAAHKTVQSIHEEIREAQTSNQLLDAARRQIRLPAYIPRPVHLMACSSWRVLPACASTSAGRC